MKKFEEDKSFLAKWVENRLTPEELTEFQSEEEFSLFDKINKHAADFTVVKANVDEDYSKVKQKISSKGKVINLKSFYYVAASVAVILSLFWFVNSSKTITAKFGEKLLAELPDGSKIHLNAGSEISYKRFFWSNDKVVNLEGEAYFDVVKGSDGLQVISESGTVDVLGTKFNIVDRKQYYKVICYSGKVSVTENNAANTYILEKGDQISIIKNQVATTQTDTAQPDWMNGISLFKNEPFSAVLEALERQYAITIKANDIDVTKIFTGSFVHDNLSSALKTTLPVMGISYQFSKDRKEISLTQIR